MAAKKRIKGLKLRGSIWWWRGKIQGRRYHRSTKCRDYESAVRRALDIQRELRDQRFGWRTDTPTWDAWLKTYLASRMPTKAPSTQRIEKGILTRATPFFTGRPLDAIRQSDCLRYLNERRRALTANPGHKTRHTLAEATIQRERRLLSAVFEAAVRDGLLKANPWRGIKGVRDKARHRVLLPDAEDKLRKALSPRFQRFLTFLLQTGLRLDECRGIEPARDIREGHVRVIGKGRKERYVPLTPLALQTIQTQLETDGALWTQNPQRLREVLSNASRRAKIPHLSPHDLRHTFGHRWLQRGGDIYKLSRILGHASVSITERHYAYLLKEDLADAMRAVMEGPEAGS